ncbi:hypothetical protein [Azospirillum rugosum]|uniref:Uncharacterized protein n=1 Tax=Azospirillum rugosum TaxID=416170 RepID=A0ABS4SED7_9PROT|nr:hypothetical protein [Azospirillum rugosum]MBP2290554.1 hypothetical protein [Azospirillum rugosum]MDQ0525442.1 hypothetical protein [Azospirillum rugosum]
MTNRKAIAETTKPKGEIPAEVDPQQVRMFLPTNARGKTLSVARAAGRWAMRNSRAEKWRHAGAAAAKVGSGGNATKLLMTTLSTGPELLVNVLTEYLHYAGSCLRSILGKEKAAQPQMQRAAGSLVREETQPSCKTMYRADMVNDG